MKTLLDLYNEHTGKVSDKWMSFFDTYQSHFQARRADPVRLLEIGIQNGGSLEIWSKYFEKGQLFIGCDINPKCAELTYDDARCKVIVGDANQSETQARIKELSPTFDIIIDDGSHTSSDIIRAFFAYFPLLSHNGYFIIEDLCCSYWKEFQGGLSYQHSAINCFKKFVDIINFEFWSNLQSRCDYLNSLERIYGVTLDENVLSEIHSIAFYNSFCVIQKKPSSLNTIGLRKIVGRIEKITDNTVTQDNTPVSTISVYFSNTSEEGLPQ